MPELAVLWEDADVLAVDKPAGVVSSPRWANDGGCLPALMERRGYDRLFLVHRLDKAASGVMLFAKTKAAHAHLNRQFSEREVHKRYVALVHGEVERSSGRIDRPIRQYGSGRMGVDERRGAACLTSFERLSRWEGHTLLRVSPHTGRRHQIRVHLYSIGHPVVGDLRYGERTLQSRYSRLMLHASAIRFRTPSGKVRRVAADLPAEFEALMDRLKQGLSVPAPDAEGPGGNWYDGN
jgi:tRNA pseudouridine32 synthase/23S rRNA pseudouridine746 synthase